MEWKTLNTIRIYETDSHARRLQARVLSCEEGENGWLVELDRTIFYPTGGGQPCDMGTLGGADVTETLLRGETVLHRCTAALPAGADVTGEIDWARRLDLMQQHSGEHIVSGMLCAAYNCDNTGFHLGEGSVIIDYNADIPWEGVLDIETRANRYIWENHSLVTLYPTAQELAALPYRSKKELTGQVRITQFPGADMCACCGTHVSRSGQVGLVKFIGWQKFRDGVRLELLCGQRALEYLSLSWQQNSAVGRELSVKPDKTAQAVERLLGEVQSLKARCAGLEEAEFHRLAEEHRGAGNVLLVQPPMEPDSVRRLCDAVSRTCSGRCAVFAGTDDGYKYAVIHPEQDITPFMKAMNAALRGRGGGRDGFAQGSAACTEEEIRRFWAENT